MSIPVQKDSQITALLIAPNRDLAQQFVATLPQTRAFQILADLKSYPPAQTLEIRIRQLKPHAILLDLATDLTVEADSGGHTDNRRFRRDFAIAARRSHRVPGGAL